MLQCMIATRRPPRLQANRIERFYAEVKRDDALKRAVSLRAAKDAAGARAAAREAAEWDRQAQELLKREKLADAQERRDYFARLGIELAESGDLSGARKAAKQAERWEREAKKLTGS